jgi:hypothetical protein
LPPPFDEMTWRHAMMNHLTALFLECIFLSGFQQSHVNFNVAENFLPVQTAVHFPGK